MHIFFRGRRLGAGGADFAELECEVAWTGGAFPGCSEWEFLRLKMSLPYTTGGWRKGHELARTSWWGRISGDAAGDRQAVKDARACLTWFGTAGLRPAGDLGTSIGSSVGYIALVHDRRVRAGGFFHVSMYFADVVSQGMTTNHVWEGCGTR